MVANNYPGPGSFDLTAGPKTLAGVSFGKEKRGNNGSMGNIVPGPQAYNLQDFHN